MRRHVPRRSRIRHSLITVSDALKGRDSARIAGWSRDELATIVDLADAIMRGENRLHAQKALTASIIP
jgi:hypothetical protein